MGLAGKYCEIGKRGGGGDAVDQVVKYMKYALEW